jgi:hypothetical protein
MNLSQLSDDEFLAYDEATYPNWFEMDAINYFKSFLLPLSGLPNLHFIQVGAYRGHASKWLMENVLTHPTSTLTDIDCWIDGYQPTVNETDKSVNLIERAYHLRIKPYKEQIHVIKGFSNNVANTLANYSYDFVYIDGDHLASSVFVDANTYASKLKPNGILAFDDYLWYDGQKHPLLTPKIAIDEFLNIFGNNFNLLSINSQVWLKLNPHQ